MTAANERRRALKFLALLAMLGLLLAACGGGGDDEPDAAGDTSTSEAQSGGDEDFDRDAVLRIAYDLVGQSHGGFYLDPIKQGANITDDGVLYLVLGRLMRLNADGELVPDLAESAEVVDGNTIEVVIREGATFHDGSPFDAAAVKAGLERSLAATDAPGFDPNFLKLESVEVTGPNTITLKIGDGIAASWYDTFLGNWMTSIVPADFDPANPVGAGPMRVVSYNPEQKMVMERYEDYWDAESILVGGVELVHAGSTPAALAAVRAGQADVGPLEITSLAELTGNVKAVVKADENNLANLMLCKKEGPLSDPKFRKAINKAIDRQAISDALFEGVAVPATTLWPEGHRFYRADLADELAYDLEAAKELLAESDHAEGAEFTIYMLQSKPNPDVAQIIQQQLAEIGVKVNLTQPANYVGDFMLANVPGAGVVPTMGVQRITHWTGEGISNICDYKDPELEELAAELATVSTYSDEAVEIQNKIDEIAIRDALSVILHFGPKQGVYDSDRINGEPTFWNDRITFYDVRGTSLKKG